ncbi:transmembrane protein, putative (macronuclear) [Tetrahymena thermophila SB210]|uniref:Transmembrane protein, putative n=1 Tax=Tetrahymena thermophila (strain SB210) TaxID=312017 RepID=Q236C0_TETTS|nr:transmembrane protein, putative [Tetrahymena thermophila SB210]EAR92580.1 transmembrane protein, putative [Tetrahymena thermophila SB210]|eukprot:XP_001012825.1 transmembrane protein, putative [Tetrahymena thermophila SB210]
MSYLINIPILLLSIILVQANQKSVSQCLPKNNYGCLDILGDCAQSTFSCADYCSSNSDCHLNCCYQNYCIAGSKCIDNSSPSNNSAIFLAIFLPVFFGTFFLIIIIICIVRKCIISNRNKGVVAQTNQAAINNQFQMNQEMLRQNAQMQQMYYNQQPQQVGAIQPYNYQNNFQPAFDNQIPQMQPYNMNQMYYPQQQYMQPQQQFQPTSVNPSQQMQPQQAYTQKPPENNNKQQLVTYI